MNDREPLAVIDKLTRAINDRDLEALVATFADDYLNETPVHPLRGFKGSDQVRRNWEHILGNVPDIRADVIQATVDGNTVWTEWDMSGTRVDGLSFSMRGVVIFKIVQGSIRSARFYLEPAEESSGDVNAHTVRVAGEAAPAVQNGAAK